MADEVKVGVIGCGGIAQGHLKWLGTMQEATVCALMDPDGARIEATRKNHPALADVPAFEDYREMLESADLDAVVICSPHNVHYEQIVSCLRAGLHVLTEKPMVCSIDHAKSVMEEEEKSGKVLALSYQRHGSGAFQFIKKSIESGQGGPVQFVSAFQGQNWLKSQAGKWRQKMEISCGGQLNDSGSHLIDIILWMTGLQVEAVSAAIDNCGTEVDINSALALRFTNGALGNISVVGHFPTFWEDITIGCSQWAFCIRQGELTVSTGIGGEMMRVEQFAYGSPSPDHNFIEAILGREEVLAPSVCGLRTIELTEAAWKSAATGKVVRL